MKVAFIGNRRHFGGRGEKKSVASRLPESRIPQLEPFAFGRSDSETGRERLGQSARILVE